MRFRAERDDQIEIQPFPIVQLLDGARLVLAGINADFLQHGDSKGVEGSLGDTGGLDIERASEKMPGNRFRHRRTDDIKTADKQHGLNVAALFGFHSPQPFQCRAAMRVNRRRDVLKSSSTLPCRRSVSNSAASLCKPRLPISMASIWVGLAVRIAS